MKQIVHKLYPVLFADEFCLTETNYMDSMCFDKTRFGARKDLLLSALSTASKAGQKPIEDMTTFKPFNVRETRWEVWDLMEAKYENFINLHQKRGMFDNSSGSQATQAMFAQSLATSQPSNRGGIGNPNA